MILAKYQWTVVIESKTFLKNSENSHVSTVFQQAGITDIDLISAGYQGLLYT